MPFDNWLYRKKIIIDHTKIDSDLTDFPIMVKLTSKNFDFSKCSPNGYDIRFVSSDGKILSYDREEHDPAKKEAIYWVKIPYVSSTHNTSFYMYYGNPSISDGANPTDVWDNNYVAVYHLSESGSEIRKDSTKYANNGTPYGGMGGIEGKIDGANSFDGVDGYISINSSNSLNIPGSWTLEMLAYVKKLPDSGYWTALIAKGGSDDATGNDHNYILTLDNGIWGSGQHVIAQFEDSSGTNYQAIWSGSLVLNTWHYIYGVYDTSIHTISLYIDNVLAAQATSITAAPNINSIDATIGRPQGDVFSANNQYFNGFIDEARISNIAHSPAWIKATYYSENDNLLKIIDFNVNKQFFNKITKFNQSNNILSYKNDQYIETPVIELLSNSHSQINSSIKKTYYYRGSNTQPDITESGATIDIDNNTHKYWDQNTISNSGWNNTTPSEYITYSSDTILNYNYIQFKIPLEYIE